MLIVPASSSHSIPLGKARSAGFPSRLSVSIIISFFPKLIEIDSCIVVRSPKKRQFDSDHDAKSSTAVLIGDNAGINTLESRPRFKLNDDPCSVAV